MKQYNIFGSIDEMELIDDEFKIKLVSLVCCVGAINKNIKKALLEEPPTSDSEVFNYMEVWKDIKGFENLYQVSNFGRVKRLKSLIVNSLGRKCFYKERILNLEKNNVNYKRVTLSKDNNQTRFQVHRLVAIHFIPNEFEKPCVNHIDGDGTNNNVKNLEWCTYSENEIHSYRFLGKVNPIRKLSSEDVEYIRSKTTYGKRNKTKELSEKFSVSVSTIKNVIKGKYYV